MTDVGPRTREMAARMCSARANAEAAPNGIDISHPSGGCFTPNAWKRREQALAYATFCTVIDGGANPRKMAENWAEAEARLRTNEYPTPDMWRIPGTSMTRAERRAEQRRKTEAKRRKRGARVRGPYKRRRR